MADFSVYQCVCTQEDADMLLDVLNISVAEAITTEESVTVHDPVVELEVSEDLSLTEDLQLDLPLDIDIYQDLLVTDVSILNDLVIEVGVVAETLTVQESTEFNLDIVAYLGIIDYVVLAEVPEIVLDILLISVNDEIEATESPDVLDPIVELDGSEDVALVEDFEIELPVEIDVHETFLVTDVGLLNDLMIEMGVVVEAVAISEAPVILLPELFAYFHIIDVLDVDESLTVSMAEFNLEASEDVIVTEYASTNDLVIELSGAEDVTVAESVTILDLDIDLSVFDVVTITEYASTSDLELEVDVYDDVAVVENINTHDEVVEVDVFDAVTVVEDLTAGPGTLEPDVYDEITVTEYTNVFDTRIDVEVSEDITATEDVELLDLVIHLEVNEYVLVGEARAAGIDAAFNDILRGYPFIEQTIRSIMVSQFENGVEQRRDKWGRSRKKFTITFPVMGKAEAENVRDFYESKSGPLDTFEFTNPIDGITRTVRFEEDSFDLERRYFNAYFGSVVILEVF